MGSRFLYFFLTFGWLAFSPKAYSTEDDFVVPLVPSKKTKAPARPKGKAAKNALKVTKPGRGNLSASGDDLLVPLVPNERTEMAVTVAGDVSGATLFLDGREMGKLPLPAMGVTPGLHSISVRKPGYREFQKELTLLAGRYHEVIAQLTLSGGLVHVESRQEGVEVRVDGQMLGDTPLPDFVLSPGTHELVARKKGFVETKHTVLIREGSRVNFTLELTPLEDAPRSTQLLPESSSQQPWSSTARISKEPPLYQRWYVWALAGAVVVSAATYGIVSTARGVTPLDPNRDVCRTGACDVCIPASRCGATP